MESTETTYTKTTHGDNCNCHSCEPGNTIIDVACEPVAVSIAATLPTLPLDIVHVYVNGEWLPSV